MTELETLKQALNDSQDALELLSEEKRCSEAALEELLAAMPGHVYWQDTNFTFLGCNDNQAKSFGLSSREAIVGTTLFDYKSSKEAQRIINSNNDVLQKNDTLTIEETLTYNGQPHIFLSKKIPMRDKAGNTVGLLGISFDITERKKAEKKQEREKVKAIEANNAKTQFIANMSHDLRTPLHSILGISEILKHKLHYPEQEELINSILESGQNVLTLIEDVLDFSKIEANKIEPHFTSFNLSSLLRNILSTFTPQAIQKRLALHFNCLEDLPVQITCDADIIRRILLNLLNNAIKFTDQGTITLNLRFTKKSKKEAKFAIEVTDTGIGIPSKDIDMVFERFYRANSLHMEKYQGTGLGLSIVKQLVDAIGGTISVKSTQGKGSTFLIELTAEISTPQAPANEAKLSNTEFSLTVLLVEDDLLAQKVSSSILKELGCQVELASNAAEAFSKATENSYDLIFMDIGLPDKDGLCVTQDIRDTGSKTPIYALTAHASNEDQRTCEQVGMNGFLVKPASYDNFQEILSTFVEARKK